MDAALKKLIDDTRSEIESSTKLMLAAKENGRLGDFSYHQGRLHMALTTLSRLSYYLESVTEKTEAQ